MCTCRDDLCFLRADENLHQRAGEDTNHGAGRSAKNKRADHGAFDPLPDAVCFLCAVILGDKSGKCVSEILSGQIGKRVDFHSCRKRCHNDRTKAVDQALHHQDTEVHDGLLDTGQQGKACDFFRDPCVPPHMPPADTQLRQSEQHIARNADSGNILRKDCGCRCAFYSPVKYEHKHQVEGDIQGGRYSQENERNRRISHRSEQRGEKVIEEGGGDTPKDHPQVVPHERGGLLRRPEGTNDPPEAAASGDI